MQCAGALWALRAVLYSSQLVYSSTLVPEVKQLLVSKSILGRQAAASQTYSQIGQVCMQVWCVLQPRRPPDEERQFKHDAELKDLDQNEKKEEVRLTCKAMLRHGQEYHPVHFISALQWSHH